MTPLTKQSTLVVFILCIFVIVGTCVGTKFLPPESKEIAAALLGTAGTIFAGWIAWAAVQRQITDSRRPESQARDAVKAELANVLADINYVWEILDHTLPKKIDKEKQNSLRAHAITALPILQHSIHIEDLRQIGASLGVIDKLRYRDVVRQLESILKEINHSSDIDHGEHHENDFWKLMGIRTQFSHFERYLRAFDEDLAKRFDSRTKSKIDHRSQAEMLAPLLKEIKKLAQS